MATITTTVEIRNDDEKLVGTYTVTSTHAGVQMHVPSQKFRVSGAYDEATFTHPDGVVVTLP